MKKATIILGGGVGTRAGGDLPKQFQKINGKPMLWWSIEAFHKEDALTDIFVMLHPNFFDLWEELVAEIGKSNYIPHTILCGGRSRWHSVYNGLLSIDADEDLYVAIHDGARPMLSIDMIRRGWECAKAHNAAIPVVPLTDSIRNISNGMCDSVSVDRNEFVAVQTPQIFNSLLIKRAYTMPEDLRFSDASGKYGIPPFTDDASVVEYLGEKIWLYSGEPDNLKVTNPQDFAVADLLLRTK